LRIRACEVADLRAVQEIYAHHTTTGSGTFEEEPPPVEEMARRFDAITVLMQLDLIAAPPA
jgi:L-amino acid N-acyltransferase YncA